MGPTLQWLLQAGLAASTQRAYMAGKNFLPPESGTLPLPATEQKLSAFWSQPRPETPNRQVAVRHLQISSGEGDPRVESMPVLQLVLRGARREQSGNPAALRKALSRAGFKPENYVGHSNDSSGVRSSGRDY